MKKKQLWTGQKMSGRFFPKSLAFLLFEAKKQGKNPSKTDIFCPGQMKRNCVPFIWTTGTEDNIPWQGKLAVPRLSPKNMKIFRGNSPLRGEWKTPCLSGFCGITSWKTHQTPSKTRLCQARTTWLVVITIPLVRKCSPDKPSGHGCSPSWRKNPGLRWV